MESWHLKLIDYVNENKTNKLLDGKKIFNQPLVGIAAADDPIFARYLREEIIGSDFKLPGEWLPGAQSVIAYFLPFTGYVCQSNYDSNSPSTTWLHARFLGEEFNMNVRRLLVDTLIEAGGKALAPAAHENYCADYEKFISNWSERHVAYAAGLGSFGLSRGFITDSGMAGRFGSVITDIVIKASSRNDENHFYNCPFMLDGSCGVCIERCPSGAITEQGKNKQACYSYTRIDDRLKSLSEQYGYEHSVCGKCLVNVPCETSKPGLND